MKIQRVFSVVSLLVLLCPPAHAFFSTFDTGDTLKENQYQLGLEPQYILNHQPGLNVVGHLDVGASETHNFRFVLGSGVVPFQAGAFYKFVPIPDYDNQPAIGVMGGVLFSNQNGISAIHFRIHPIISKRFATDDSGIFTPYASIPFGISAAQGAPSYPFQFEVGTKWQPPGAKHMSFWAELGLEINAAFSYISTGITVPFDSWSDIKFD